MPTPLSFSPTPPPTFSNENGREELAILPTITMAAEKVSLTVLNSLIIG